MADRNHEIWRDNDEYQAGLMSASEDEMRLAWVLHNIALCGRHDADLRAKYGPDPGPLYVAMARRLMMDSGNRQAVLDVLQKKVN